MTISRWILLRMTNASNKSCRENQNTQFLFSYFFSENRAVYELMSKNMLKPEGPQTMWRLRVACWIRKATRTPAHAAPLHPPPHVRTISLSLSHTHALVKASERYVIRTLPLFLNLHKFFHCDDDDDDDDNNNNNNNTVRHKGCHLVDFHVYNHRAKVFLKNW
jgi:hypothetical protein